MKRFFLYIERQLGNPYFSCVCQTCNMHHRREDWIQTYCLWYLSHCLFCSLSNSPHESRDDAHRSRKRSGCPCSTGCAWLSRPHGSPPPSQLSLRKDLRSTNAGPLLLQHGHLRNSMAGTAPSIGTLSLTSHWHALPHYLAVTRGSIALRVIMDPSVY